MYSAYNLNLCIYKGQLLIKVGRSWPWSYGSWICNYLCNQCLSPLMLWVWISIKARCTTLCDESLSLTCDRFVVFSWSSGFLHQ